MDWPSFVQQCHNALLSDHPTSKQALHYLLNERGLSEQSIVDHMIGYCGGSQATPSDNNGRQIWALRGRLVIPIYEEFGDLIAVSARSSNSLEKGWWNTSFPKNKHLFLFNRSRHSTFDNNKVYIFEGYMDGIVLYHEGLTNVCSLMGVALGYRRIGLLKRYCTRVCLVFDQDANRAGQMAHDRSIYELSHFRFDGISKITLPIGVDPDEFVLQHGLEEFLGLEKTISIGELKETERRYLCRREDNDE